ncbi:MAG TPA: hypothetical protein VK709_11690 [Candidatus Saccharimonadales bacterium]|nr:hypothetical protein [Candidatus Saccharimonadales bacterium]
MLWLTPQHPQVPASQCKGGHFRHLAAIFRYKDDRFHRPVVTSKDDRFHRLVGTSKGDHFRHLVGTSKGDRFRQMVVARNRVNL